MLIIWEKNKKDQFSLNQAGIVIIDLIFLYWASYGGSEKNNIISTIISTSELKLREQTIKCFQRFSVFFSVY